MIAIFIIIGTVTAAIVSMNQTDYPKNIEPPAIALKDVSE